MVTGFIFLLEENRNLWLKPDCKAQVCTSSWRLAALWWPGSKSLLGEAGAAWAATGSVFWVNPTHSLEQRFLLLPLYAILVKWDGHWEILQVVEA